MVSEFDFGPRTKVITKSNKEFNRRNVLLLTDDDNDKMIYDMVKLDTNVMTKVSFWNQSKTLSHFCDKRANHDMIIYLGQEKINWAQMFPDECLLNTKIAWLFPYDSKMKDKTFRYERWE